MNDEEKLKATLMANMKKITKRSAIEAIIFLMGLRDITLQDIVDYIIEELKEVKEEK